MNILLDHIKATNSIKGIVYVGANTGQEVPYLQQLVDNIILVEPIPQLHDFLMQTYPKYLTLPYALGSSNSVMPLYLASNNGESSSVLKPVNHTTYYPDILFEDYIEVGVRTFKSLVEEYNIDISKFNILITDAQGYDLEAIRGFDDYITSFDLIIAEYIDSNLYENDATLKDICDYLEPLGFKFIESFDINLLAGNAVFRKTYN